jgi:hypothetical protein
MAPVNYQRHCIACHELPEIRGNQIAHEELSLVRSQLGAMTEPDLRQSLPGGASGGQARSVPGRKSGSATDDILKSLSAALARKPLSEEEQGVAQKRLQAIRSTPQPTLALAEFHVAYTSNNSCAKCHQLRDVPTEPLEIVPTGIPDAPRRWFVHSSFDHDAHRNVSCAECHGKALSSRETRDALLPAIRDCTSCHHPDRASIRGASAACVTCHSFHDRTRENGALRDFLRNSETPAASVNRQPP